MRYLLIVYECYSTSYSFRFKIDTSVRSKQLPTLILFVNGEEKIRKPSGNEHPKAWYYRFTKVNLDYLFCGIFLGVNREHIIT